MPEDLPSDVGVGFKSAHFADIMAAPDPIAWVEVHAENYMGAGGVPKAQLFALRQNFPVSLHGVGLSLGAAVPPDPQHLKRLKNLIDELRPAQISEHLAWVGVEQHGTRQYFNDLLPVDYGEDSFATLCVHIDQVQQFVGRAILIENPSSYVIFDSAAYDSPNIETDFLARLVEHTGCGLLLDVNNVYVSCVNLDWSAEVYLQNFPMPAVGEIHLAGHAEELDKQGERVLIDNHGAPVADDVWQLYEKVLATHGALPTLIEWDTHIPTWAILQGECRKAARFLANASKKMELAR